VSLAVALTLVLGLVLLVVGAEALVRGAARLAGAFGISSVVIGLTVVAFGTSAPELAVSVRGALFGAADVAMGNVVGSNLFNVLVILGLSAIAGGLVVHQRIVRLDVPLVIAATGLVWLLAHDGTISRWEGILLIGSAVSYTAWLVRSSQRESAAVVAEFDEAFAVDPMRARGTWPRSVLLVIAGLALLVVGADRLVVAAVSIATALGVSDLVIGLTVVAAGTSLPELATSVVAAMRGERDIAVGNVVGSNLFNLLVVLGGAAAVAPRGLGVAADVLTLDLPFSLMVMVVVLPVLAIGLMVRRWEGALLLAGYSGYGVVLFSVSQGTRTAAEGRAPLLVGFALLGVVLVTAGWWAERRSPARTRLQAG
jgi:cation:H+ antiporter